MRKIVIGILSLALLFLFYISNRDSVPTPIANIKDPWVKKALAESQKKMTAIANAPNTLAAWPPVVGKKFPDISLIDSEGNYFAVKSWLGKPTLIEVVAMTCAGCQAFSGGAKWGGYEGFAVQGGLESIEHYYNRYTGGREMFSGEINFAQIIIYNLTLEPTRVQDLASWRRHFRFDAHPEAKILTGGAALANSASYRMIPGFILLDSNLNVIYDSTGHSPKHNLYTELLPGLAKMLGGGR